MPELIDRQAVLAEIGEFQIRFNETGDSHERVAYASAEHCKLVIKAAPTIKAEPVRHGRWIPRKPDCRGYTEEFMCSECNAITYMHLCTKDCKYDFCPNCGAEMDGGADNG